MTNNMEKTKDQEFAELLEKIATTAERRDCLLSEFKEWLDYTDYIQEKCGHWQGIIDDNGKLLLGRLWYKMLDWKYYNRNAMFDDERVKLPFHCYGIKDDDVWFTKNELEWDETNQRYKGILVEEMCKISDRLLYGKEPEQPQKPSTGGKGCLLTLIAFVVTFVTAYALFC